MKLDTSPHAVTCRLRRVSELVRVCRALAGRRRKLEWPLAYEATRDGTKSNMQSKIKNR
jgi:hypothetical protein